MKEVRLKLQTGSRPGVLSQDKETHFDARLPGKVVILDSQEPVGVSLFGLCTAFELLPASSVAAGTDKNFTLGGTSAISARGAGGGVTLTTKSSSPTTGDQSYLTPVASTYGIHAVTAQTLPRWFGTVTIPTITTLVVAAGFCENATDPDPTGTAGEGAMFLFDPGDTVTTAGVTTEQHANWILAHKVNGVDTFTATSIPVVAGESYRLKIIIGIDLTAKFYINDVLVGTGPALTSGDSVKAFVGVETKASAQRSVTLGYLVTDRLGY